MIKLTWKIWLMLIVLALALLSIFSFPPIFLEKGVVIKSVESNSTASEAGLSQGEIITSINGIKIDDFEDYSQKILSLFESNEGNVKIVVTTNQGTFVFYTDEIPEIIVEDIPKTRLKTGLDLQGGARALVQPEVPLSSAEMSDLIAVSSERFNVYGLKDVKIRQVSDLSGNNYMLIEIAGATPSDLKKLVGEQGKFEAKIGNETVFTGGNQDITYVCRNDATCARIKACYPTETGEYCSYSFSIHVSEEAAKLHAQITGELGMNASNPGYLDKTIDFYVDDQLTNSLLISKNLQGLETTSVQIQGSGSGQDRKTAYEDAEESMRQLQTILITGSLPYKLEIVKLDTISPVIGEEFSKLILILGLACFGAVAFIIFARYRTFKASLALLFTSFSEILIILGIAALINWNLDLPSIVGILVTIGTGVDQQIVILDESKSKRAESIKQKIKVALFIIVAAYLTTTISLLPLWWAGAGLLKGFMVTTLIGLTMGVLVTRPAFADMIKLLEEKYAS